MRAKRLISFALAVVLSIGTVSVTTIENNAEENAAVGANEVSQSDGWEFESIETDVQSPQPYNTEGITISAGVSGNTEKLTYKFVWQKDNWKSWGVIQNFSEKSYAVWTPKQMGDYKIYVDIKDADGKVITKNISYTISDIWQYEGITTDLKSPQEKYTSPILVTAMTSGETEDLQYKFVWQKDNWKSWGVFQNFSSANTAEWNPEETGNYTLYVDVKDKAGKVITKTISYTITSLNWTFKGIEISPENEQKKGETITIHANVSGNTEKMQYKYVWMKDNWSEWGVIQNFSEENEITWKTPEKTGTYYIYVDVKDRDGKAVSMRTEYALYSQIWQHNGVNVNDGISEQVYSQIPVNALVEGETENLQYKYVWMKDNWKSWGVIQGYSENPEAAWYPKEAGIYTIYADVKDVDGRVITKTAKYEVLDAAWKLEEIQVEGGAAKEPGSTFEITAYTTGETEGLQYRFSWQKTDSSVKTILQDFAENNTISWTPEEVGEYKISVEIMDQRGVVFDAFTKNIGTYIYNGVSLSHTTVIAKDKITIAADITGGAPEAQYKIVWQKNNWSEWGVIQNFSTNSSVTWAPSSSGNYTIYIDMKVEGYGTVTKTKSLNVYARTIDRLLGTTGTAIINELNAHRYDSYYLGTPFKGLSMSNPTESLYMHPNGSPASNGSVGMNCTGFVAFVFQKCGADLSKIAAMGGTGGCVNASNWMRYVRQSGAECYGYSSVAALLRSGKAEKGDIIYCEPNWSLPGADCHIGIFWGDTSSSNTFWHQFDVNRISNIKSATQVTTYFLIKTSK